MKYLKFALALFLAAIFVDFHGMGGDSFLTVAHTMGTYRELLTVGLIAWLMLPTLLDEI